MTKRGKRSKTKDQRQKAESRNKKAEIRKQSSEIFSKLNFTGQGKQKKMTEKLELGDHIKNNPLLYKTFLLALEIIRLYKSLTEEKYEVQDQRIKKLEND